MSHRRGIPASMAIAASPSRPSRLLSSTNCRQTRRIAAPLSLRKWAMVLKSGATHPGQPHQFNVTLRLPLQAPTWIAHGCDA